MSTEDRFGMELPEKPTRIVLDYGGYTPQFLFGEESPATRTRTN